jgi:5'-3' exonuclease
MKDKKGHFNYSYKLLDNDNPNSIIKGWWVETNKTDADKFIWYQMLMGDSADNITGIPRVGKETAKKWLKDIKINACPEEVLSRYIAHYRDIPKAIFEYQKNYRLLYLLRTNEDFMRECDTIPITPEFNSVIRNVQSENIEF